VPHLLRRITFLPGLDASPNHRAPSPDIMSDLVQAPPSLRPPLQSVGEIIAPGIIGLFVQGLESGLVLMQLSRWFYLGRTESISVKALVLFVTTVGLSALTQFL
jgi:hypothetical protein